MFVFGIVLGLPGAVLGLPEVVERLGLSLTVRGTLISTMFLGLFVGSAVSGPLVDRFGHRRSLAVSAAAVAICLAAFGLARSATGAAIALSALGACSAGINTAGNALVSDGFPDARGARMNTISIAVGSGGLLLAIGAAFSAGSLPWQTTVFGSALLALAVAGGATLVSSPLELHHRARVMSLLPAGLRHRHFAVLAVLLMLSSANESSMAGWTSTYLIERGLSPVAATWALAAHWAGLIAGRLMLGSRVERRKAQAVLRCAIAAFAGVALLAAAGSPAWLLALPAVIGICISVVTPTLLALGGDAYPQFGGTVFGVLLTAAQVGAIVVPASIGIVADQWSVRAGLLLLLLTSAGIAVLIRQAPRPPAATDRR
jgi:MFS family permease